MLLTGPRIYLRPFESSDAPDLLQLNLENRAFFAPRESQRDEEYYTLDGQLARIEVAQKLLADRDGTLFGAFLRETDELIGTLALFGVIRAGFQEARIGYMFAEQHSGNGYPLRCRVGPEDTFPPSLPILASVGNETRVRFPPPPSLVQRQPLRLRIGATIRHANSSTTTGISRTPSVRSS